MFMTSEPLGNFHQSERMYRVLRSVGCMELLQNGKFLADCAQNVCQVFGAEYCSLNSLKRSKRLFLLSLPTGFGEEGLFTYLGVLGVQAGIRLFLVNKSLFFAK